MNTKSTKGSLIWLDVKSWLITTGLTLSPIVIGLLIQLLTGVELGAFKETILLALGALLKLAQKWSQANTYK